jgi:4-hydroxyacetophenone monooxygenase
MTIGELLGSLSDSELAAALEGAELPALLATVAHITGDLTVLRPELCPDPLRAREPQGGYSSGQQQLAQAAILDGLRYFRDVQRCVPAAPVIEQLQAIMDFLAGAPVSERYVPLLLEELAIDGDLRAPPWRSDDLAPGRTLRVVVIGAGMSGIAASHRLQQAGIDHVVLEKNDDVGGTWLENRYPGCRVDVQNHMYSYSFAQKADWPYYFSSRDVLRDYFRECAERFGVLHHVRFGTEVVRCSWDDAAGMWQVVARDRQGCESTTSAHAVISAVGQLNRPKLPDIAGRDTFAGSSFHSAQWNHSVDLRGKKVAVIGSGASACQFVPPVAEQAGELRVYQRTPPWLIPAERYRQPVAGGFRELLTHVPFYAEWYRFWLFWRGAEGMLPAATVDPGYPPTERAVSETNEQFRQLLLMWMHALTEGDPVLREQLTPHYPPLSKRFVVDDGSWVMALRRPNVQLVTVPIQRIEADGIRTEDGELFEADMIIYGTGFQASQFLSPMTVTGRGGVDLHRHWGGDARAYLGIVAPGFPNFFFLYGPNTNIVVNGSIIYFSECEVHYVMEYLRTLLAENLTALDCRTDVHDAYNRRIDAANRLRTWGFSTVSAWYKNEFGRTAQNWPFSVLEYWEQTRHVDIDDYEVLTCS